MYVLGSVTIFLFAYTVSLNPRGQYVTVPGGEAVFRCSTEAVNTRITSVQWIVNNTLLSNRRDLTNHVTTEFSPIGNGVGALRFFDIPIAYNTTRIRCSTVAATGIISESISSTLVLLQGILAVFYLEIWFGGGGGGGGDKECVKVHEKRVRERD